MTSLSTKNPYKAALGLQDEMEASELSDRSAASLSSIDLFRKEWCFLLGGPNAPAALIPKTKQKHDIRCGIVFIAIRESASNSQRSVDTRITKDIIASDKTCPGPLDRTVHYSEPVSGSPHEGLSTAIKRIRSNPFNLLHDSKRSDLHQSLEDSKLFPVHQIEIPLLEATSTTQRDSTSVEEVRAPFAWHTERHVTSYTYEATPETYGWSTEHIVRESQDEDLLEVCTTLGQGSLGIVEEVRRKGTQLPTFVRKRFIVPFRRRNTILRVIQEEVENLKFLSHPHVVTFVGSYEERKQNRHFYCLLMSPVGDNDLREFLEIYGDHETTSQTKIEWEKWLRGCSSAAFEVGHTTSTDDPSRSSPMYAAPKITRRSYHTTGMMRHGRSADVFALGCVFSDMLNTWQGYSTSSFHHYLASGCYESSQSSDSGKLRPVVYNEMHSTNVSVGAGG
ncbi:hypothetical protein FB567DRAFT_548818 [Paraphoma chrysanthemicola]|uniref:Protein kinase domain-containing protein n=1 Tax=Paraphoma chrysanthemicola TaxID=798071 RepID=A0A8K0R6F9_9PLEO|nr:hypothetical protein FB567DRAFT_548818 [Paraphoma chrysanthemicola]